MLIRFEVSNYRSILDRVELTMVAVDRDRQEARTADKLGESLLPVAAVFGPNASGKSNVFLAFAWLRDAVRDSLRFWDRYIPVEPFAFGDGPGRTSEFRVEFLIRDVRFEYVLELDRSAVQYEGLFHYPEKKRRRIFEREGMELKLQRGLGSTSGTRELLTKSTLALSAARRFDEPLVFEFARHLLHAASLSPSYPYRSYRYRPAAPLRSPIPAAAGWVRTLRWFEG
ncbi:MAG: AAA family ATPase, partial [Frankia sp.]|nr:AAA family ATPase [Frankia sp.]